MSATAEQLGDRLETVRDKEGVSLRAFWRRLVGGEEGASEFDWHEDGDPSRPAVGYRTVTRYHRGEREAPVGYLARVAEEFGVRIEWLVAGRGPRDRRAPRWVVHPRIRALEDRGFWDEMPLGSMGGRFDFLDLLRLYDFHDRRERLHGPGEGPGPLGRDFFGRADDLRFLLRLPLVAWGFGHVDPPPAYWRALSGALHDAVKEMVEGGETRDEPFVLQFRRAYEGDDFDEGRDR